jgi:transglutaminase-like putative cysteine protease
VSVDGYRRLLGVLLVWAVLPLPFLYIVLPPFWLVAGGIGLLLALWPGLNLRLSPWMLNVIGVGIIAAVVIAGGLRVGPLRPLGHLLLLLTSVRLLVVKDRPSFFRGLLPVFLVWVVALTSSTHVSVVLYFAASAGLWWWIGMRVLLAEFDGTGGQLGASLPRLRHALVAAVVALLLAIPFFLALPRLRSPWIAGRGGVSSVTGFSSQVDLAGVGPIHQSREIAMIVRSVSGDPIEPEWMRLRATALERVTLDSWTPRGASRIPNLRDGLVWPHGEGWQIADAVELEVELHRPRRYLFLPEGTVAIDTPVGVRLDPASGVVLASRVRGPLTYRVWVTRGRPPRPTYTPQRRRPRFPLPPEARQLAENIVNGIPTHEAQAAAVEAHLQENYGYSMNGMARMGPDPVAWFLLHNREGHCEYFAGAMVAMLTDLGIPARMVGGYSGGSLSTDGEEAIVREANAHAWVEAWVGLTEGWTVFDPTPAGDVPSLDRPSGRDRVRWAWEWTQSSWDRYVLTFGLGEQMQLLGAVADGAEAWLALRWRSGGSRRARFRRAPAAAVIARIARRLGRAGVDVPPRATVRWIGRRARVQWPAAAAPVSELVWLAERELYAGQGAAPAATVQHLWAQVRQGMRREPGG